MICALCEKTIEKEKRKLEVHGTTHYVHNKCIRKATKKQLVDKNIITPTDHSWRLL